MPEYLSPGVYVEERPPQLRAIEGVSTSTAGFVGVAQRGPTPGFPLPFDPTGTTLTLVPDPTPVLVTSFSNFLRQFGPPLPLPDPTGNSFLGYAIRGFFNNGGLRAYIARVISSTATYSALRVYQGTVIQLTAGAKAGSTVLNLNTLRLVNTGTNTLTIFSRTTGQGLQVSVTDYDSKNKTVTLSAPLASALSVNDTYIVSSSVSLDPDTVNGPVFWAKNPGAWSQRLTVSITPSDGNPTPVLAGGPASLQSIVVKSTSSFYVGAIVEIDRGGASFNTGNGSVSPSQQELVFTGATGGTTAFTLSFNGQATAAITFSGTPATDIAAIQGALNGLSSIGGLAVPGSVTVTAPSATVFVIAFAGSLAAANQPMISVAITTAPGTATIDAVQTLTLINPVIASPGPTTFTLTVAGGVTAPIILTGVAATDATNLQSAIASIPAAASATVQPGTSANTFTITSPVPAGTVPPPIVFTNLLTQRTYHEVTGIQPGGVLQFAGPIGATLPLTATVTPMVRVCEINITITDPTAAVSTVETYNNLTWNPHPAANLRHYATVINAGSELVYVEPPGLGIPSTGTAVLSGSESATIDSQPTTVDGLATSPWSVLGPAAIATVAAVNGAVAAVAAAEAVVAAATFPIQPAAKASLTAAAANATQAATDAQNALEALIASGDNNAFILAAKGAHKQAGDAATAAGSAAIAASGAALGGFQTNASTAVTDLTLIASTFDTFLATIGTYLGDDGDDPKPEDYQGVDNGPGHRSGIQNLIDADDISIIAAPGQTSQVVQDELIEQCGLLRYRFAVLDGEQEPGGAGSVNAILTHRENYDSSYAAYYAPWFQLTLNNQNVYVPPSGHVIGIYAGTDNSRGVWKAPANVVVQNITGLKFYLNKGEQDILNPQGVNLTRKFHTTGTRVWGARTISSDTSLMYVNVRRTLIFLEASIDHGTQWVVFEPNTPDTWDRLTDSVSAFLLTQWREGALFGLKPEDSFRVRCDETTMTADDIQSGRLICEIGVAIVRPAEFVIFRIEQTTGYANQ